jgi:N-acetyl-anhydromuramyl-L-alanine amidase AmpD
MNIVYKDQPVGPYDERDHGIDLHISHTTEGRYAGDLDALTHGKSVHKYVPKQKGLVHRMVPFAKRAWHAGWGKWGWCGGSWSLDCGVEWALDWHGDRAYHRRSMGT